MSDDAYIKVTTVGASASPIQEQFDQLTAERDALQCQLADLQAEGSHLATRMAILERDAVTVHRDLCNERVKELEADNERLRAEVEAERGIVRDERKRSDALKAEVANMRTVNLASQQVIVDAFAVQQLAELREAGERMLRVFNEFADMVTPTPETAVFAPPLGEATENFRAVLAKTALALT